MFSDFFQNALGLCEEVAKKNACQVEHAVDDEVFIAMSQFYKKWQQGQS